MLLVLSCNIARCLVQMEAESRTKFTWTRGCSHSMEQGVTQNHQSCLLLQILSSSCLPLLPCFWNQVLHHLHLKQVQLRGGSRAVCSAVPWRMRSQVSPCCGCAASGHFSGQSRGQPPAARVNRSLLKAEGKSWR